MLMEKESFQTSDLALASYLHALGAELAGVDRSDSRRVVFLLELAQKEIEAVKRWQEGKATTNALAFYNSYQTLKRRLYSRNG